MLYAFLKTVHLLAIIVWIGGMVFAHFFLRPALAPFEPPVQLRLMHAILGRFFAAVLVAAGLTLASGGWMIGRVARQVVQSGAAFTMPIEWVVMAALGGVMVLIFGHIRFVLYKRLDLAVISADWPTAAAVLASLRTWVTVNLALGIVIIVITLFGAAS